MTQSWHEQQLAEKNDLLQYRQEYTIVAATEAICQAMKEREVNRVGLSRLLNKTKGYVSQILNGNANLTLRTLSDALTVLGYGVKFQVSPLAAPAVPANEPPPEAMTLLIYRRDRMKIFFDADPASDDVLRTVLDTPQALAV